MGVSAENCLKDAVDFACARERVAAHLQARKERLRDG